MTGGLRIAGAMRGETVRLRFDGREIEAHAGEMLAAALWAAGIRALRCAPGDGGERGMFCAMGVCQECVVVIDGQRVEACRTVVRAGLDVMSVG